MVEAAAGTARYHTWGAGRVGSELQEHEFVNSGAETAVLPATSRPARTDMRLAHSRRPNHLIGPGRGVIAEDPRSAWWPFQESPWFGPECFFGADASDGATTTEAASRLGSAGLAFATVRSPSGRGDLVAYHVRCFRRQGAFRSRPGTWSLLRRGRSGTRRSNPIPPPNRARASPPPYAGTPCTSPRRSSPPCRPAMRRRG